MDKILSCPTAKYSISRNSTHSQTSCIERARRRKKRHPWHLLIHKGDRMERGIPIVYNNITWASETQRSVQ